MRFGINAQRLLGQRLGVGRYIEYLLKHWSTMLSSSDTLSMYVPQEVDNRNLPACRRFRMKVLSPRLNGLLWEQLILSNCGKELDVLFGPSYTLPLSYRGKSVVAIHSANETQPGAHSWWYFPYRELYKSSAQKADMVIVPS